LTQTDLKIERQTIIRAPRTRVWQSLTTPAEFAKWFRVEVLEGRFEPGMEVKMKSTYSGSPCEGELFSMWIESIEPQHTFSWRWHPGMRLAEVDYSKEPMTRVVFTLEETDEGTRVTVIETGFDEISLARRARVFGENDEGWREQMVNLEQYVDRSK